MQAPQNARYDVVIIGGAIYGSSIAWWLTENADFNGSILVVERDPTYTYASTSHTNSCIRQQFSHDLNIKISQFGAEFIHYFRSFMGDDPRVPDVALHSFGYMYLANNPAFAAALKSAQERQASLGAATRHLSPDQIKQAYPFYNLDDIIAGNHNRVDEGYFDGSTLFDWWKRVARERGVEFVHNEVTAITRNKDRIESVTLAQGQVISLGTVVNCSGTRAAQVARMAGIDIPVEPRKRYSFIFQAADPLDRWLPLTIDPSGVHMRSDGRSYLAGCPPDDDKPVAHDDFAQDHTIWEEKVWPILAHRIPQFERIKLVNSWVGHYDYNTLDQNAIIGPHSEVSNFIFSNGFSGHGLQQSPAIGRGIAEWIATGSYQTLDLNPFGYARIAQNDAIKEYAVI